MTWEEVNKVGERNHRAHLDSGVRRLVQADGGAFERKLGRYFPTLLPPSPEVATHG